MDRETAFELIREFIVEQYEELQPEEFDDVNDYVIEMFETVVDEYAEHEGEFGNLCRWYQEN